MFRIELKKDDMNAEKLDAGDSILLECPDTKLGGVGLAFLSSDTSKTQGRPTLKIYDPLKKMFGLTMEDKCIISKFNGKVRRATKVIVSDVSAIDNPVQPEIAHALGYWVGSSLGMLGVIEYSDGIDLIESQDIFNTSVLDIRLMLGLVSEVPFSKRENTRSWKFSRKIRMKQMVSSSSDKMSVSKIFWQFSIFGSSGI